MKKRDRTNKLLKLAKGKRVFRVRDAREVGIHQEYVRRLYKEGVLERVGWGMYMLANADIDEHQTMAEACKRVPEGVVCLLSALRYYGIGTQNPREVWIAIDRKARKPQFEYPPIRIARFSGRALHEGIETKDIGGVEVKVFNPAKTVVDCFKYRNKIGLDVALEALKECRRGQRCTMEDIVHYAKICRVFNVMRPYLESLS